MTCAFICHDGQGRFVLYKRSEACRDNHGVWDCGAGELEHGEEFEDAVSREVREEYNADAKRIEFVEVRNVVRRD